MMTTASKRNIRWLGWHSNPDAGHASCFGGFGVCLYKTAALGLVVLCFASISAQSVAQSRQTNGYRPTYKPRNHEFTRGDMAPGVVADIARMSNPRLQGHVQPVRVIVPRAARVGIPMDNGYVETNADRTSVGLTVGPVYRFKVTDIPNRPGRELYPSVEILNRLNPPAGLENEFPIEIVISLSDLEEALEDRMVTKIIYLESPDTALPHRHLPDKQPYFDIGGSEDPLRVAEGLGRPMAILRIGSRIPMPSDAGERFGFNAPSPQLLPSPTSLPVEAQGSIEPAISSVQPLRMPNRSKTVRPVTHTTALPNANLPPIVQARRFAAPPYRGQR